MGIRPATDLVFDVMQAADPARARQVTAKLRALTPSDATTFARALALAGEGAQAQTEGDAAATSPTDAAKDSKAAALLPSELAFSGATATGLRNAHALSRRATETADATRAFEAMLLSHVLNSVIPSSGTLFGTGTAGESWRSMLAEKVGEQVARAGGVGIAALLERSPALRDAAAGPGEAS